ncbi:MAG: acetyl-CoA C-acetyltransferase [Acidimicrobiales bacterium]|jgi:acetyl-CoA C-acetyltransferase
MPGSLIVSGARTAIGKLSGALSAYSAMDLGGLAIQAALSRAGVAPEDVDYVVMGQVLGAGQGQITARQAAVNAGIPMVTPATTVNKVCLSGLNAIHLADLMIRAGEAAVVVAGGMESMTRAPYLLPGARAGYRLGDQRVVDSMMHDGLFCAFDHVAMGMSVDVYSRAVGIPRERQDALAAVSHERAAAAIKAGRLAEEIVPVSVPQRKGEPIVFDTDEGVRPETTPESLAALRPAFSEEGTVTAGNASQISDGAAAVIVMSPERADELGLSPLGEIIGYGQVAGPDASLLTQPSHAIREAVARAGLELGNVDLFEISEAFAAVQAASTDDLGVPAEVVNVNGGAIALGHPIGMSGTRLAITMLYELRRRGGGIGAVGLCGGGGQGDAAVLRVYS